MSAETYSAVPENEGKPTHCTFAAGHLSPCWPLAEVLEEPYGRGTKLQGAKLVSLFRRNPHEFSREAVSLVSGKQNRGIQLTFCPFCASILQPSLSEEVVVRLEYRRSQDALAEVNP